MIVGIPKETAAGERRVALVPDLVAKLVQAGVEVVVQSEAGIAAGFLDAAYREKGGRVEPDVLAAADVVLKVQPLTVDEIGRFKDAVTLIGFLQPYSNFDGIKSLAARRVTAESGRTTLKLINGLGAAQNRLTNPPFIVAPALVAAVVDDVLESMRHS